MLLVPVQATRAPESPSVTNWQFQSRHTTTTLQTHPRMKDTKARVPFSRMSRSLHAARLMRGSTFGTSATGSFRQIGTCASHIGKEGHPSPSLHHPTMPRAQHRAHRQRCISFATSIAPYGPHAGPRSEHTCPQREGGTPGPCLFCQHGQFGRRGARKSWGPAADRTG